MDTAPPAFIERAPRDVAGWAALFKPAELPVLEDTAVSIEDWRAIEDEVDAHLLAESLAGDPLMTLKLLAHVAMVRRQRGWDDARSDVETVTEALVLLGIGPFFRAFGPQPSAEQWLATHPPALAGFQSVLRRAHRAANFAIGFAAHRMDHDAALIHQAALLHDFAELLLWLRAPTLALAIRAAQQADPGLRSAQAQKDVLNIRLPELQQALMKAWRLPALLTRITDERHADDPQVRNVILAVRLARHSADGWGNAAIPDDVADVARLLQLGEEPARRLLEDIDSGL